MADISALINSMAPAMSGPQRGSQVPDHASQLVGQMLQAHVPDLLAETAGVKLLINDSPVVRGEEVYGAYDPNTRSAEINRPANFTYIDKDKQPTRYAEQQLDTPTVMDMFNSAVHELQHGRSHARRKTGQFNGAEPDSAIQKIFQSGVSANQLSSLLDSIVRNSKNLPSAQKAATPELMIEELLTYGAADKLGRDRFGLNTKFTNDIKRDVDLLKIQHPWLTGVIDAWAAPAGAKK